jgi:hypothetical protein
MKMSVAILRRVFRYKLADVLEVLTFTISRVITSETSVNFCQATWRNVPEDRPSSGLGLFRKPSTSVNPQVKCREFFDLITNCQHTNEDLVPLS